MRLNFYTLNGIYLYSINCRQISSYIISKYKYGLGSQFVPFFKKFYLVSLTGDENYHEIKLVSVRYRSVEHFEGTKILALANE